VFSIVSSRALNLSIPMALILRSVLLISLAIVSYIPASAQVFGEVLYSWDFATGLPTGWTNTSASNIGLWEYRGPNTTPSSSVGPRGTCSSGSLPIQSQSRENGFMLFDSNYWDDAVPGCGGLGTGSDPAPHTAWLTSQILDFSVNDAVVITFQEQYRLFSATCKVQVSVNNGAWQDAGANTGLTSVNAVWTTYNLSALAAFQSNVRIRFQFEGVYYWWQIDDIAIYSPLESDLMITSSGYTVNPTTENLYNELEYDQYPSTMLPPLRFQSTIRNIGSLTQTGVTMTSRVLDSGANVVHTQTTPGQNLVSSQSAVFQSPNSYTPPAANMNYSVEIVANVSGTDQNPANNITNHNFSITPYTYARDEGPAENFFVPAANYATEPLEIGNVFEGRNSSRSCRSIQVALGEGTEVGSQIQAVVYNEEYDQIRASSLPYTVNLADINQIGEEKMVTLQLDVPVIMYADTFYIAMVRNLDGNAPLRVCRSGSAPPSTAFVNYYNFNALFFLLTTPVVRMNIFPNNVTPGCTDPTAMNFNAAATVSDGSCRYPGCTISYAINYDPEANFFDDSCIVPGCTDPEAFNYDPLANVDNGSCINGGCTNPNATNFDPAAEVDDGSCIIPGCTIPEATNFNPEATEDDGTCVVPGCTDPVAANYNPNATFDDGSCVIAGCTNPIAINFNPMATLDNGTCIVVGCLDPLAANFNPLANQSDNSCIYPGCTNPIAENYNPQANEDDGSCVIIGCTNEDAINFNPEATQDDGTCQIEGCTDEAADNYNPDANIENGSCIYIGCTDPSASNFDPTALDDDGSCIYPGCSDNSAINFNPQANEDDGSCLYSEPVFVVESTIGCAPLSLLVSNQTATNENSQCEFYINNQLIHTGCENSFTHSIELAGSYQIEYRYTQGDNVQSILSETITVLSTPAPPLLTYDEGSNEVICTNCTSQSFSWMIDSEAQSTNSSSISSSVNNIINNGYYTLIAADGPCSASSEPILVLEPSVQFVLNDQCAPAALQVINQTDLLNGAVIIINYGIGNSLVLDAGNNFFSYINPGTYDIEVELSFNSEVFELNEQIVISEPIIPELEWLADQDLVNCSNCDDNGTNTWTVDGVEQGTGSSISDNLGIIYSASLTNAFGCIGTSAIVISNVDEVPEMSLSVFPNPSSGQFRVTSNHSIERVVLVNALGQEVWSNNTVNHLETLVDWDIQGSYVLKVYSNNRVAAQHILIVN